MQLLLKIGIVSILPLGLVALQPDLGTILVFIAIIIGMVFISGVTWKILLPVFSSIALIGGTLIYLVMYNQEFLQKLGFKPYQFKRITSWLRPEEDPLGDGMQLLRSMQAIGSGQLQGMESVIKPLRSRKTIMILFSPLLVGILVSLVAVYLLCYTFY